MKVVVSLWISNKTILILFSFFSVAAQPDNLRFVVPVSTKPQLCDLMTELVAEVAHLWKHIGDHIGVPGGSLDIVGSDHHTSQDCLRAMFSIWLRRDDPSPTWSAVINAIESLGYQQLANDLRHKYIQSPT